jgi:cell division protein FtsB
MRDFKKERLNRSSKGDRRRQYLRMATGLGMMAVLGLVAVGSAHAAWGMYQKFTDASAADAAGQAELASMQTEYQSVSTTVTQLGTDRGLEAAIRNRYGVGKPGEGEIDIVPEASSSAPQSGSDQNWFERLWHAVFVW